MASLNDFGREIDEARDHPHAMPSNTRLDDIERRLREFFSWAEGRSRHEVASRFGSDFVDAGTAPPLSDSQYDAIIQGRGSEIRSELPIETPGGASAAE